MAQTPHSLLRHVFQPAVGWACLALALIASPAGAQVNIEPFSLGQKQQGWAARVGANFSMEANETVLLEVDLAPRLDYAREKGSVAIVGEVGFSERAGTTFRNLFTLHARYLRQLSPGISAEAFARAQRDEFALLNQRLASGAGVRFKIAADEEAATFAGISFGFEGERWEVDATDRHPAQVSDPRAFGYLAYRIQITEHANLLNTISGTLRLGGALDDARITDTAALQVTLSERVALTASFGFEYDSRPPQSQPKVSMALKNGLTVSF